MRTKLEPFEKIKLLETLHDSIKKCIHPLACWWMPGVICEKADRRHFVPFAPCLARYSHIRSRKDAYHEKRCHWTSCATHALCPRKKWTLAENAESHSKTHSLVFQKPLSQTVLPEVEEKVKKNSIFSMPLFLADISPLSAIFPLASMP